MKKAKKYTTFSELKSDEKKASDNSSAFKKHSDFEKVIREMMPKKFKKTNHHPLKH